MDEGNEIITSKEAHTFLRDMLGVTSSESRVHSNREALLKEIITAWRHHIPFQSVKAISTPHENRHLPSLQEIKQDIFSKIGGLCYDHNIGCYLVLRALGYDVTLATCDISFADSHVVCIVRNLNMGSSKHLIDVGSGYPTFLPIPLDFADRSPEYHDSFLRYRFVRREDVIIRQHHADTDPRAALFPHLIQDGWYSFIYIHYNKRKEISYFDDVMTRIYSKVLPSPPYLSSPRCVAWPNGRFVCIKDTTLLVESEEGRVQKSYFKSPDELVEAFITYFPQIPMNMIKACLKDVNVKLDFEKEV